MKKAEKTQLMRERILEGAIQEIASSGYQGFRINQVCKKYGFSKGSLYHLFPNKDQLYLACVEQSFSKLFQFLKVDWDSVPTLSEYLQSRLRFYRAHPHHSQVFLEALLFRGSQVEGDICRYRDEFDRFNQAVARRLVMEHKLKKGVTEEQALAYLDVIQKLFRTYYLTLQELDSELVNSQTYEDHLQEILGHMVFGIVDQESSLEDSKS